ncbi:hypothetical protein IAR50_007488 [Cryptococcus sp. DSM 104548]
MSAPETRPETTRPARQSALRASSITTALALGNALDDDTDSEPEFKRPSLPPREASSASTTASTSTNGAGAAEGPPKKRRGRPPGSRNKGTKASFLGSNNKKPVGKAREGRRAGEACTWCRYRRQKCDERDFCSLCQKDRKGCVYLSKVPRHQRDELAKPMALEEWNEMKDDIEWISASVGALPTPPPSPAVSQKKRMSMDKTPEVNPPVPSYRRLSMAEADDDDASGEESDDESPIPRGPKSSSTSNASYPTPEPKRAPHLAMSPPSHHPFSCLGEQAQNGSNLYGTINPQRIHDPAAALADPSLLNALALSACGAGATGGPFSTGAGGAAHVTLGDVELDSFEWCAEEFRGGGGEGELVQTHVDEFSEAAKSWSTMNEFTAYESMLVLSHPAPPRP